MRRVLLAILLLGASLHAKEVYATFNVVAQKSANLAFTASGRVESVFVDIGDKVKKNQRLAELENSDLKAALRIATTALKFAKKDYDRQLRVKKLVDAAKLDAYAFKYENAKAKVDYQKALLNKTILKAPFDGIIYDKSVEVGDAVSGARLRTVFKIQSEMKRKLILEFDQKYWQMVHVGQTFTYSVDGDKSIYKGKISKVYPFANSSNRKIRAEVPASNFPVGLFGDGYILIEQKK